MVAVAEGGGGPDDAAAGSAAAPPGLQAAVKVAVHVRPLIAQERAAKCQQCLSVTPGEHQVQVPPDKAFTFDHVYGGRGSPPSHMFDECVLPLVYGLFEGYNATVLAYGQTGSGKTYTMGTAYAVGGTSEGIIPQVMKTLFQKVAKKEDQVEFQIRVSYIEIHKEEIRDLLDSAVCTSSSGSCGIPLGSAHAKTTGRPPLSIRETAQRGITLAGVNEVDVCTVDEMAACLEQGSLCRATGSTGMNATSSRSHAIFTVILEQRRKWEAMPNDDGPDGVCEDFLCAKLHLVDLAGSERMKRTKVDGNRLQEGIHINKGLLALGNVISALGDEKRYKEGGHVPYRDSKLTRLLQDSLGGNSRTVMIACVSPADINMEESLNTLKYANRARNIQNKPLVNRDPAAAELHRLRQQLQMMQAELMCSRAAGSSQHEVLLLRQHIQWLEATKADACQELIAAKETAKVESQRALAAQVERDRLRLLLPEVSGQEDAGQQSLLHNQLARIQELEATVRQLKQTSATKFDLHRSDTRPVQTSSIGDPAAESFGVLVDQDLRLGSTVEEDEAVAEAAEMEHSLSQNRYGQELQELNEKLEEKEEQMRSFARDGRSLLLRQAYERKFQEMEEEKKILLKERDRLVADIEYMMSSSDEQAKKLQEAYRLKVVSLEKQIDELRRRQEGQAVLLRQKQRSEELAKHLNEDILRIKQQKVQLQRKMKQEAEQFFLWKQAREKEVLQLRKEGRRNEYEMHKLQAIHQRQRVVLQRKTEEAAMATKRLKDVLETRRAMKNVTTTMQETVVGGGIVGESSLRSWLDRELSLIVSIYDVRKAMRKEAERRAALGKEIDELRLVDSGKGESASWRPGSPATSTKLSPLSPRGKQARLAALHGAIQQSSAAILEMQQQLAEAEERDRSSLDSSRLRWQRVRTFGDARGLLQHMFEATSAARCLLRDQEDIMESLHCTVARLTEKLTESKQRCTSLEQRKLYAESAVAVALKEADQGGPAMAINKGLETMLHMTDNLTASPTTNQDESKSVLWQRTRPTRKRRFNIGELEVDSEASDGGSSDLQDPDYLPTTRKHQQAQDDLRQSHPKRNSLGSYSRAEYKGDECSVQQSGVECRGSRTAVQVQPAEAGPAAGCSCAGKCSRKCPCKSKGDWCSPQCNCGGNCCINRRALQVDPSAEATAASLDLAAAMEALDVNQTLNPANFTERMLQDADVDKLRQRQLVTAKLAVHAERLEKAIREGLSERPDRTTEEPIENEEGQRQVGGLLRQPLGAIDVNQVAVPLASLRKGARKGCMPSASKPQQLQLGSMANPKCSSTSISSATAGAPNTTPVPALPAPPATYGRTPSESSKAIDSSKRATLEETARPPSPSPRLRHTRLSQRPASSRNTPHRSNSLRASLPLPATRDRMNAHGHPKQVSSHGPTPVRKSSDDQQAESGWVTTSRRLDLLRELAVESKPICVPKGPVAWTPQQLADKENTTN
eukprot:SM000282S10606  [mRNA]  locus=s282:44313:52164:- [translate_table: standard]